MNESRLAQRIRVRQDPRLELRAVRFSGKTIREPRRDALADDLAAFANGSGGTLVLGATDTPEDIGIPLGRLDAVERIARRACTDAVQPVLYADIRKLELGGEAGEPGAPVVVVEVPRSGAVHRSPGGYFRRVGRSKREMEPDALERLFEDRTAGRRVWFEEFPVPGTRPDDLDEALARRFIPDEADYHKTVRKMRLVTEEDDGGERLTVAGALLATPNPQERLPHAFIQAVMYAGILEAKGGQARLLRRNELDPDWQPDTDQRFTVREYAQHSAHRLLERGGELAAGELLVRAGDRGASARDLAYRVYRICEQTKRADEAIIWNDLINLWPSLLGLAPKPPPPAAHNYFPPSPNRILADP